jgi:hypothetical protein
MISYTEITLNKSKSNFIKLAKITSHSNCTDKEHTCAFHWFKTGAQFGKPLFKNFLTSCFRPWVCIIQQRYHFLRLYSVDDRRRWAKNFVEITASREIRSTRRKPCPSSTFPTTNPTWTDLELNSSFFGEWPAPNRLNHVVTGFQIIHCACYRGPKRTGTDGQQILNDEFLARYKMEGKRMFLLM